MTRFRMICAAAPLLLAGCTIQSGFGWGGSPAPVPETGEADVWTARGNEPGWSLTLDGAALTFIHAYGERRHVTVQPAAEAIQGGRRYASADGALIVTARDRLCMDDATGMPYPLSVTVRFEGAEVTGCGGETNVLLAGEWAVVSLNGEAVAREAGMTLVFEPESAPPPENPGAFVPGVGRLAGKAGCNSYGADYRLGGEGIRIGDAFSTEMACEPDVMAREAAFFDALRHVSAVSLDDAGTIVLSDHQSRQIRARR